MGSASGIEPGRHRFLKFLERNLSELGKEYTQCDCRIDDEEERRVEIIELAREQHQKEAVLEIDDNAEITEGIDNGCYVAAWVWLDFANTKFDKEGQPA